MSVRTASPNRNPPAATTRRMRVVTLVDYIAAGGAERAAIDIATRLGDGVESIVVASRLPPDAAASARYADAIAELDRAGVRFFGLGRTSTAAVHQWTPLIRLLRTRGVHVLHSHSWGSNFWGPWLARLGGVPIHVAHEQTPFARRGGLRRWGRQIVVNRCVTARLSQAIVVPSEWSRQALIEYEGVPAHKIHVIPNGASSRSSSSDGDALRRSLGVCDGAELAVIAAMLRPEKAQDVAIQALALLRSTRPRLHLLLAGGGTPLAPEGTRPALEALAGALGVADRVHFLGRREDVQDLVAASDIAVLCSEHENLPLAVLEYMEAGTPIVATRVGGVPELLDDRVHALLVPSRDASALATAIVEVLDDPAAAHMRAAAARERRRTEFEWGRIAGRVKTLYGELLAARTG